VFRNIIFEILIFFQKILHKNVFKDLIFSEKCSRTLDFVFFILK